MKLFQLNFFGILVLLAIVTVALVVPSFVIQSIWNSVCSINMERDMNIAVWQAAFLWGAILSLLYMSGIFSFRLNFKTLDSIDLDAINDPELRAEIEKLKLQAKKVEEAEKKHSDDSI